MRKILSDKIVNIKPSGIRKFFDLVSEMEDVISLGVGEPDFETPWHIRDEGIYAFEKGRTFYTSNSGLKDLRTEICNYLNRKIGVKYDPMSEVLVTVGGSEAIDIGLRALINDGDEVIIPQPSYVSYEPCAVLAGAKPVIIDLKAENKFRLTADELRKAITDKTKILVLPFPNNPTGAIMEEADLKEIAKVVIEKDILVMSDEIYSELTYKGKHHSIVEIEGMKERTILINGFSKAFAMTGWRLGTVIGPKKVIAKMGLLLQTTSSCVSSFIQKAGMEAINGNQKEVIKMMEEYKERRDLIVKGLNSIDKISCLNPGGAFYVFPDIRETELTSQEFAVQLLESKGVGVCAGADFGAAGEGFVRLCYATSQDEIKEGIKRIKEFVDEL